MVNNHMKMWSASLLSGTCKLKPQWDSVTLEWLKLKRSTVPSVDEDVKQMQFLYTADRSIKCTTT